MSKVDWITWKTDRSEIINPEKILEEVTEIWDNYHCYMHSVVYEGIKHEIMLGGLDGNSLNIMGTSPAYDKAIGILNRVENIQELMENLKNKISEDAKEQKEIEKKQLIEAIEDKIREEEKKLQNTTNLKERLNNNSTTISIQEVDDIIDITKQRLIKLKERLEAAKEV